MTALHYAGLKALTPADPYVTLPPHLASETAATASHHQHPQGPPSRAALPPLRRVPLLLHLTELDLSGAGARSPALVQFPVAIERLQAAAPNLRLLRLDAVGSATYFRGLELGPAPATLGPGFPRLRVCELGLSRATSTQDQTPVQRRGSTLELLRRTVGGSPALRCLDVSGAMGLLDQTAIQVAVLDSASPSIAAFTRGVLQQDGGPDVAAAFGAARAAGAWVRRQGDGRADDDENGEDEEREALLAATAAADVLEAAEAALLRASGAATGTASGSGAAAAATATASRGGASAAGRGAVHGAPASTLNLRMPGDGDCRLRLCASLRPALRAALVGPLRELRASRSVLASDAGLHGLARLLGGTLQVLDVSESTHVTDAGLLHVAYGCTALRSLDVSATGITDWGVRRLMALAGPPPLQQQGQRAGGAAAGAAGAAVSGSWAGQQVVRRRRRQGVIDLVSDSGGDDEDEDVQAGCGGGALGGNAVSAGAGVGCRRLTYLDISKCRGVDRATRHAAAEGLQQLRQQLGLWATT
ncbi:hypothetical protein CHLRE_07g344702v5 [Chlamydomonas reinhardtii]|uniref:Uncharacterized protein n=1 Tax=Chlamydomonas reinhardtii TaxID=3055 RepID=A0A2K3DKX1_CHLRE|nr:uncharacterized protein CHLRE_07g344702v5 [Chlamydomonas reinhardtii]PNW81158.1 hypothetical protein CHLRE_07g344702v5 [Chlamydomonas reinhardtii]